MNNLSQLQKLLAELMAAAEEVLQSGEQLDDAFLNELADEIEATQAHIQQMEASQTPEQNLSELANKNAIQPKVPPMEGAMPSSNINSFAYDPRTQNLYVKFQGDYPFENGSTYKYGGVPQPIAEAFANGEGTATTNGRNAWGEWWEGKNPSMGAALNQLVKSGGYPYERIHPSSS